MNEAIRMQLSAFVDGELPDNEKELLLRRLSQDAELRRELGEYLVIGRAMRGEFQPAGMEFLRERIGTAIESGEGIELAGETAGGGDRRLRPLAGFAIAAAVALVAIIGLQQTISGGGVGVEPADGSLVAGEGITQPSVSEYLEQLRLHHDAAGPENNITTVLTSIELGREAVEEQDSERPLAEDADGEADVDDTGDTGDTEADEPIVE